MQVIVQQIIDPLGCWNVQLGKLSMPFRTESEARLYASRLESRLKAPHPWPKAPGWERTEVAHQRRTLASS